MADLNYYIDLDIETPTQIFSFQIFNNNAITKMFSYFNSHHVLIFDPLQLEKVYFTYKDPIELNYYINRNFKNWAKEFNLDKPRNTNSILHSELQLDRRESPKLKNKYQELINTVNKKRK